MREACTKRIGRTLTAMLLMFVLSFGVVFADADTDAGKTDSPVTLSDETQEEGGGQPDSEVSHIVKEGKYYYYREPSTGKIRKKKGFVEDNGKLYYIKNKKGRIVAGKTFTVKRKKYRAFKNGVIATGVYKWKKKYYYSKPSTGQWIKKEKIVSWKGNKYYIQKGGVILRSDVCSYKNVPYRANSSGKLKELPIPDGKGSTVVAVAKRQVGIMTGKKYWKWYFKTRFINTDLTPWCGVFVAWCYNKAGLYKKISSVRKYGNLGYVPSYSRFANKNGKWINRKKAKSGDIIVFGRSSHVGIVEGVSKGYIITIEGNSGPTAAFGSGKPGAVTRKVYKMDSKRIKGVIRMK